MLLGRHYQPFPNTQCLGESRRYLLSRSCLDNLVVWLLLLGKAKSVPSLSSLLSLSDTKINVYHAEIRAAPHQALCGLPEDWAVLCSGEPKAGGPGTYPFEQCLEGWVPVPSRKSRRSLVCFGGEVGCCTGLFGTQALEGNTLEWCCRTAENGCLATVTLEVNFYWPFHHGRCINNQVPLKAF